MSTSLGAVVCLDLVSFSVEAMPPDGIGAGVIANVGRYRGRCVGAEVLITKYKKKKKKISRRVSLHKFWLERQS